VREIHYKVGLKILLKQGQLRVSISPPAAHIIKNKAVKLLHRPGDLQDCSCRLQIKFKKPYFNKHF